MFLRGGNLNPRLKMAVVLPGVQILLAVSLSVYGNHQLREMHLDYPVVPAATQVCSGLNAPAFLVRNSVLELTAGRKLQFGAYPILLNDLVFFLAVGGVWYLVGAGLDRSVHPDARHRAQSKVSRALRDGFLASLGIFIGFLATPIYVHGAKIESGFFMAWAVILLSLFSYDLYAHRRRASTTSIKVT